MTRLSWWFVRLPLLAGVAACAPSGKDAVDTSLDSRQGETGADSTPPDSDTSGGDSGDTDTSLGDSSETGPDTVDSGETDTGDTGADWMEVSIFGLVACGRGPTGLIACWGDEDYGEAHPPSGSFVEVSVGQWYGCALDGAGAASCWGLEGADDGLDCGQASPPTGVFRGISASYALTCALDEANALACWGQLELISPSGVPPAGAFQQVSLGFVVGCALAIDGTITNPADH